ncbi:MAG: indole-3-glycerol phosphate synthase [Flavobacteriaceae bacterium]|nr:indole-3-glycerol phosphate synthase [Flavobacteriaceae bacterium]|tara:strand:+ start:63944 stop:64726 length:783 start_codon:yes stop_codon:yes gene_type:complete
MTILEKITLHKKQEVTLRKQVVPMTQLVKSVHFSRSTHSLSNSLKQNSFGIIAEHKRKSPSKSVINDTLDLTTIVSGYEKAGAKALSVLTDTRFFGGSLDDLLLARETVSLPILRKDFIVAPYQVYEAKAYGADAVLLIAASLSKKEISEFSNLAKSLQLEVLVEIHSEEELEKALHPSVDLIGINNRNLKTFEVDLAHSKQLSKKIPSEFTAISESGIHHPETIKELLPYGFKGFLIGEYFMKNEDPGASLANFLKALS